MSRLLISTFAVLALALPTALSLFGDPADIVAVVALPIPGAARAIDVAVAAGGQVAMLHWNDRIVLTRSTGPGFVARLYAAGALLVVPLPMGGCAPTAPRNGLAA